MESANSQNRTFCQQLQSWLLRSERRFGRGQLSLDRSTVQLRAEPAGPAGHAPCWSVSRADLNRTLARRAPVSAPRLARALFASSEIVMQAKPIGCGMALLLCSCNPLYHPNRPAEPPSWLGAPSEVCSTVPVVHDPMLSIPELVLRVTPKPHASHDRNAWACAEATVTVDGTLSEIRIVKTNSPFWARDTVESLKKWRYKPALRDGHPVEFRLNILTTIEMERP